MTDETRPGVDHADPEWATFGEGARLMFRPRTLRRTIVIAAIVGTLLVLVNQASTIANGRVTTTTWARVAANYLVPFCVSSAGYLSATRTRHNPQS